MCSTTSGVAQIWAKRGKSSARMARSVNRDVLIVGIVRDMGYCLHALLTAFFHTLRRPSTMSNPGLAKQNEKRRHSAWNNAVSGILLPKGP
jgi:hypothetical protein